MIVGPDRVRADPRGRPSERAHRARRASAGLAGAPPGPRRAVSTGARVCPLFLTVQSGPERGRRISRGAEALTFGRDERGSAGQRQRSVAPSPRQRPGDREGLVVELAGVNPVWTVEAGQRSALRLGPGPSGRHHPWSSSSRPRRWQRHRERRERGSPAGSRAVPYPARADAAGTPPHCRPRVATRPAPRRCSASIEPRCTASSRITRALIQLVSYHPISSQTVAKTTVIVPPR